MNGLLEKAEFGVNNEAPGPEQPSIYGAAEAFISVCTWDEAYEILITEGSLLKTDAARMLLFALMVHNSRATGEETAESLLLAQHLHLLDDAVTDGPMQAIRQNLEDLRQIRHAELLRALGDIEEPTRENH